MRSIASFGAFSGALLALTLLAGCSYFSSKEPDYACPKTGFLEATDRVTFNPAVAVVETPAPAKKGKKKGKKKEVAPPPPAPAMDKSVTARIPGFNGDCSFKKKGYVEENLILPFTAQRGPDSTAKEQRLSYFIAILSPDEEILQRTAFTTTAVFDEAGRAMVKEEHTLRLPMAEPSQAWRYKVIFGFELTPEQLTYNKEH